MYLTHFPRDHYIVADHSVKALSKPTWTLQPTFQNNSLLDSELYLKNKYCGGKWGHLDMLSIQPYLPDENTLEVIASGELPLPTSLLKGEQTLKSCYNGTVLDSNNFSIWVSCMPRTIIIRDNQVLDVTQNGRTSSSFSYIEFNPFKVIVRAYKMWRKKYVGNSPSDAAINKGEAHIKKYLIKFQKELSKLDTDIICINYTAMMNDANFLTFSNGKNTPSDNWVRYNLDYRYHAPTNATCVFEVILKLMNSYGLTNVDLGNSVHMLPDGYSLYVTPHVVIPKRVLLSEGEKNLNSTLNLASAVLHSWSEFFTLNNLRMSHECDNKWSEVFNAVCTGALSVVDQSNIRELTKDAYRELLNNNKVTGCLDSIGNNEANDDAVKLWGSILDIGDFSVPNDKDDYYSHKDPLSLLQKVIMEEPTMSGQLINMPLAYIANHADLPTDDDIEYGEVSCNQDECEHCSIEDYENCQNMEPDYDNPYVKYSATQHFLSHGIVDAMSTTYDYLQNYGGDSDTLQELEVTNDFLELTEVPKDDGKIVNIRGLRDTDLVIPLGKIWLTDNKEAFEREQLRLAVDELIRINLITLDNIRALLDSKMISTSGMIIINEALRNALPSLMQKYTIQISNLLTEFPPSLPF